jgi:hypothetical protein
MPLRDEHGPILPYRPPAPRPAYPPFMAEVGCCASALGAVLLGSCFRALASVMR